MKALDAYEKLVIILQYTQKDVKTVKQNERESGHEN